MFSHTFRFVLLFSTFIPKIFIFGNYFFKIAFV